MAPPSTPPPSNPPAGIKLGSPLGRGIRSSLVRSPNMPAGRDANSALSRDTVWTCLPPAHLLNPCHPPSAQVHCSKPARTKKRKTRKSFVTFSTASHRITRSLSTILSYPPEKIPPRADSLRSCPTVHAGSSSHILKPYSVSSFLPSRSNFGRGSPRNNILGLSSYDPGSLDKHRLQEIAISGFPAILL